MQQRHDGQEVALLAPEQRVGQEAAVLESFRVERAAAGVRDGRQFGQGVVQLLQTREPLEGHIQGLES
jgi:hypothetical protein